MRAFAVTVLAGALAGSFAGGASATMQSKGNAVVLHPSTRSFKELEAACSGTLGSVTFAMNHTRYHATPGVEVSEKSSAAGISTITFSDKAHSKSTTVEANAHNHTISGKDVIVKANGTVACVR